MATPAEALQVIAKYKYLTSEYYRRGLLAFGTGSVDPFTPGQLAVVSQIAKHENAHATALATAVAGAAPRPAPNTVYDFTGGTGSPFLGALGAGGIAPFTGATRINFFKLAQLFEDFAVRITKGQVLNTLSDAPSYALLAGIHAVEGRHAAEIRTMRTGTSQTPANATTASYTTLIFPWPTASNGNSWDANFSGAVTSTSTQAYVASLAYGIGVTGAALGTTMTNSEANQVQFGVNTFSPQGFDEPADLATASAFVARFNVTL
jgi:hypothetical protein